MRAERSLFSALLLGAACSLGCTATVGEDHEEDETEHERPIVKGLYRVPVAYDLEPWAEYPVDAVEIDREGASIKIEYIFPTWLVGEIQEVELVGSYTEGAASFPVTAELLGSGECLVTGSHFECTETFPGMLVNRAKAESSMQAAGLEAHEVGKRLLVTDAFSVDPIGIIEFDVP